MKRTLVAVALLALLSVAALGCSPFNVGTTVQRGTNFGGYRSYTLQSWEPSQFPANEMARAAIDQALRHHLSSKGFQEQAAEASQFWVSYSAGRRVSYLWKPWDQLDRKPMANAIARGAKANRVNLSILTIHVADASSKRVVWEGWAEGKVEWDRLQKQVDEAVGLILEEFPPRQ